MNKFLTITLLAVAGATCRGQGTLWFASGAWPYARIATNSTFGGGSTGYMAASSTGSTYYFGLFSAPTNLTTATGLDPTSSGFTFTGILGTNATLGHFSGNGPDDLVVVPGYPTSSSANFLVVGWSANLGADWSQVQAWLHTGGSTAGAAWYGVSDVANSVQLGGGMIPPTPLFGGNLWQVRGFTLNMYVSTVPEPSLAALTTLGAAILLLRGRRTTTR
jgi:hypothetical protein